MNIRHLAAPCNGFKRPRPLRELYKTKGECSASGFMGSFPEGAVLPRELRKRHGDEVDCCVCVNFISVVFVVCSH